MPVDLIEKGGYSSLILGMEVSEVARPMVCMLDNFVVGFHCMHTIRDSDENLNSRGMHFVPLALIDNCLTPDRSVNPDANPNRFYAVGVITRLAIPAAGFELDEALNETEHVASA